MLLATPGVKYSNAFTGRNGATFTLATNSGLIFLVLDDFEDRHRLGQTIDKVAQDVRGRLAKIEEAQRSCSSPRPCAAWARRRVLDAAAGHLGMPPPSSPASPRSS